MKFAPHDYQAYAVEYIEEHPAAAVLLDMGLGKTVITLTAIVNLLFDSFQAHRILVIAPLRVARDTWPAEIQKWDHLRGLTWSVIIGTQQERMAALRKQADIYLINRENVQWLIEKSGMPFDFDMVVVDELSSFKSWQAKRFKSLMKVRPMVRRIIGLTGTPSSKGNIFPLRANSTAVVMMNPQPMASRKQATGPFARRPARIFEAGSIQSGWA